MIAPTIIPKLKTFYIGVVYWNPEHISGGHPPRGSSAAIIGGASIFMAYEGFHLLVYPNRQWFRATGTKELETMSGWSGLPGCIAA